MERVFVMVFVAMIFQSCKTNKGIIRNIDTCVLVQDLISDKFVQQIIGLDKSVNPLPSIRINDLTNQFELCEGLYKTISGVYIPYKVVKELSPFLNTGNYRDITIDNYNLRNNNLHIVVLVASFESINSRKTNYQINFDLKKEDKTFIVVNSKCIDISGQERR